MNRDKERRQISLQVSIALMAGMFSFVPVVQGAPTGGNVVTTTTNSEGATVPSATITTSGTTTNINGTITNNVIDWQDFSVARGETVQFDNGDKTRNYMNIVSGGNTSNINGVINGGNEVYIINPNGVIFGENAQVDVGSLYASTRHVSVDEAVAAATTAVGMSSVLNDTCAGVATDVVNMTTGSGYIHADNVVVEGKNIRFYSDNVKNFEGTSAPDSVCLKADNAGDGYIHVGNTEGESTGYSVAKLTDANAEATPIDYFQLLGTDWSTVKSTINGAPAGNYMLTGDIDATSSSGAINNQFTGNFDGNYHEISGISGASGLFSSTKGAKIYNVGLVNADITNDSGPAGAIVATAMQSSANNPTVLRNVYNIVTNTGTARISGRNNDVSGGLVGSGQGVKIVQSYNAVAVRNGNGAGFIGWIEGGTNQIIDSYNIGATANGVTGGVDSGSLDVNRIYTTGSAFFSNDYGSLTFRNAILKISNNSYKTYSNASSGSTGTSNTLTGTQFNEKAVSVYNNGQYMDWGTNIANVGGVSIDTSTGAVTRPVWRIYEGQSTPVLTSFLKGVTTVSYDYTHGSQSGSNRGADLTATSPVTITDTDGTISAGVLTYNGSYMNVDSDSIQYGGGADSSLMSYSNSSPDGVRNAKTKALFHSAQNGYDIVGGNVTMAKRQVTVEGTDLNFSHVYDGETNVTTEFQDAFSSSSGTGTAGGILAEDASAVQIGYSNGFSASFEDKNVGENKRINLTGSLTLTGSDDDILANYELAESSADLSTTTVTGTITQRPIYLTVTEPTDDRLNKTYNGNNAVNSSVSASDIFSIDGTTYDVGTQNPGYGKIENDDVSLATGTSAPTYVDVDAAGNVTTDNASNAGAHKILFTGIALTGNDANNYKLQYSDTQTDVTASQVFMDGVIRPRLLAADGFQVRIPTGETDSAGNPVYATTAANKTYDGTSTYNVPNNAVLVANTGTTTGTTGMIAADNENLWFDLSSGENSYFKDSSGNPTDMAGGANAATQVAYAVDVATTTGYEYLKGNYTFDETTAASNTPASWTTLNNTIPTVSGAGTISRRNITIATSGVTGIDKPYDGTTAVVGDAYTTMGGNYLNYADSSAYKLLADDTTATATDTARWNITAAYDNKNVVRGTDGTVTENGKTINFVVGITGADAVNYTLNGTNAEDAPVTLAGTGKITPLVLTPTFDGINKTYNGTTSITDGDSSTPRGTVTGITYTSGDTSVTDVVNLSFDPADAYYDSENAGSRTVYYPGLSLTGADSVNYDLNSTTGTGNGTINRRLILTNGFQVLTDGTPANGTKVYDGTSTYTLPEGATLVNNGTTAENTGIIDGDRDNLWFELSDSTPSYFVNSSGSATAKVADAVGIAYQTEAATRSGYAYLLNNYKIGTTESAVDLSAGTPYAVTGDGNITRRAINIDAASARNINKEYNANTNLVGAGNINIGGDYLNYVSGSTASDKLLVDAGTGASDNAQWSVNAAYDNKNVVRDSDGNVVENGKTVNFNISITGTDAANYTINGVNAETTAATPLTLTGSGKITPKEITATFQPVSKVYNNTTRINDQNSSVTGNGSVAPLTGDTVILNYNADEAYYDTPDVGTNKTVYYPNLSLTGADSGNYVLSSTTGSSTGNSISTATVTLNDFVFNFADVTRVYNGGTAVADSTQGITAEQFIGDSYIDLGTGTFDFRDYIRNLNANYASKDVNANTGTGNVTYSFNLADMTIPNISITGDYQNHFVTNPVTLGVGTITPKTVYATINNPVVTKTYNGAYDVQNYTAPLVSYSGLVGDSADASTAVYLDKNQGTDKLVQYDVAISDGSNYVIKYNSVYDAANMATYRTAANGPVITADDLITTIVTPNNVINPKDVRLTFADVTKQYDGTTSVQPVANQVALGATTMSGVESGDTIMLTGWNAVYNSPDVLTANTVSYSNITLSGNDNGNYNFIDANGNSLNANTVIDGNGAITPLALSGTYAFTLGEVTKEYDSTNAIKFTGTGTDGNEYYRDSSAAAIKNFITAPSLTINGASRQMGYELDMDNTGYNDTTVGEHPATFRVGISNSNYTFDSITVTDGTNTLTPTVENGVYYYNLTKNNATITPRKVYVALNDNPAITKVYDGTNAVEQVVTGNNNKVYLRDSTDFISGDNVDVDWNNISAVYSSENVAYDGEGNVTSQDVIYNVGLTGTDAGNYVLYRAADNTAITDANKLTGTGIITPRELTVDFARDEHPFDNSAYLSNPGSNLRLGNLATRDAGFDLDNIAKAAIGGRYTDKNVNRADDGTVFDKGLTYNNLQNALSDYATRNAIAKNYTIADSVTYSVDDAKGVITPLEITDPLKAVWKVDVNKVYDATTNLPTDLPAETNANNILTLQVNTTYDGVLSLQGGSDGYQYSSAGYESKNQGDRALKYTLTGVNANQGNYQLSDAVVSAALSNPWLSTDTTRNVNGTSVTGNISKRQLNIIAETDSKIYDGGNSVANPKSLIHFSTEDQAVITADADGVDYDVTAIYTNRNAGNQNINYTLTLNGNANGNYVLSSSAATITGDTAAGTTTGNVAKRKVYVTPININNINREYDTTTAMPDTFTNADHFQLTPAGTNTGIVAGDEDIQLNIDAIEGAYADKHAGNKTITFNNFALMDTSDAADSGILSNYTLETNSIVGSGTIYPKALTIGINAAPTKEYDTSRALSADYATKDNLTLSGVLGNDAVNLQVNSANYSDANAATDKTYSYGVSIDNTNYQLTQGANLPAITVSNNGQTGVITANDGTITKRKVYVSLADTPNIVKTYDGNTSVKQDVTDKIIVRAGDLLDDGTELNRDASIINARYDNKDAGNRMVTYNTQLKGDAAGNYEIHRLSNINDAASDVESSTLTGEGVINKAKLTLDPASISKTYNGTAVIGDGTSAGDEALTADKLLLRGVNNESFIFTPEALKKVSGRYGSGTNVNDFVADANVSWNEDAIADKDILYTGLSDALAIMNSSDSTNGISKNYTIDNTAYFTEAQAKGKIKPITITQAATENWKPVIREYNADTDLSEVYDYSGGIKGDKLSLKDILQLTVTDGNGNDLVIDYDATGNFDHKNVADNHVLNYHINSVKTKVQDKTGHANYVLDTSILNALQGKDVESSDTEVYSVITPRQLNAEVKKTIDNRKIYDGTVNADTGNFVLDSADRKILEKDNLLNHIVITAYYEDKDASIAPGADATNSKTIHYTLGMADSNDNYTIATPTGTAQGDIEQRVVYVEPVSITGIDKAYDGTVNMPNSYTNDGRFALASADEKTGIVAGDAVHLNADAIQGVYASAHVQRDADGRPVAQDIRFTNFTLQDSMSGNANNGKNYYVATKELRGSGTISPASLTIGVKEAPIKVYDGETALSATYAANNNLELKGLYATDTANLLINSTQYDDADAGTNKTYTYNIAIDNDDYELTQGEGMPAIAVTDNGQAGTLTASDGIITPRVLGIVDVAAMNKEYDGTTDGVENAAANISLTNYLAKDKDNLGLTAVATYDNANAGISEDTDELENHKVTYTLRLGNANYQLETDTVEGEGTISRKGLTVVATPASVNMGEALPEFSGNVEGLVAADRSFADRFTFAAPKETTTNMPGTYAVYGWYNNRISGNLGLNYTFGQASNNNQAFTVNYINTNMGNPDLKITPTNDIYKNLSHDFNSGFGNNGTASIEYRDKSGNMVGVESIGSGEIRGGNVFGETVDDMTEQSTKLADIGIVGGDIVNIEGADAANSAAIEVDGDGNVVNLEVRSLSGDDGSADNGIAKIAYSDDRNDKESSAEIYGTDTLANSSESVAQITVEDDVQNLEDEDKKKEKEGEIGIESSENEKEIELKVEENGVNVA